MKFALLIICMSLSLLSGCVTTGGGNSLASVDKIEADAAKEKESVELLDAIASGGETTNKNLAEENEPQKGGPRTLPEDAVKGLSNISSYDTLKFSPEAIPVSKERKSIISEPREHVELAFDNADLYEVLDLTLFELFDTNYIIDPSIKAKVTFHISGDYTRLEFLDLLGEVLQLNNLAIAGGDASIVKIVRRNSSTSVGSFLSGPDEIKDGAGDITRFIRLRYVSSAIAGKNIRPFLSKGASVVSNALNNALIVTDTRENIEKIIGILSLIDVPYFSDIIWRIFPIMETDATDIAKDLSRVMKTSGFFNRPGTNAGKLEIIPIKTMNAVFVMTRWPSVMKLVEDWIQAMDRMDEAGTGVYVYFVENGNALELSDILKQVYGGKTSGSTKKNTIVNSVATTKTKTKTKTAVTGALTGNVEIIPDETNNAIVFKASPSDYKTIKTVLQQLDIVPRQVLLNVVVSELTLTDETKYGIEWYLKGEVGGYDTGSFFGEGSSFTNDPVKVLGDLSGFSTAVFGADDVLRGLVNVLGKDSDLTILSSPNVLAVDNKEASIEVAEEVPTETGTVTDTNGGTTSTVQFKKTGIILNVTPHINSNGLVKLEVSQEVSSKGEYDSDLKNYSYLNRNVTTTLVAEDGQTIIMGGLMRTNDSYSDAGIPLLKDIPFLGYLFKSEQTEVKKTELIFLITPHVITNRADADRITMEFSNKLQYAKDASEKTDQ